MRWRCEDGVPVWWYGLGYTVAGVVFLALSYLVYLLAALDFKTAGF